MRGWEFKTTGVPLELVTKEDPKPKEGYVVMDVMAAGLCHSDVGALEDEGWLELITKRPVILGHEMAGKITEVGPGVKDFKVGDRVGLCPMYASDGTGPSYGRDGAYATKAAAPAEMLIKIPDGVSYAQAAAGTDAGMTSYYAVVQRAGARKGLKMGIIGVGGLGTIGLRIAVLKGAEVYASTRNPAAQEKSLRLGAKEVVSTADQLAPFDLDVIVDFAGTEQTIQYAMQSIGFKGKVVVVGMKNLNPQINTMDLITKQSELIGSNGGTVQDIKELYDLMATGDLDFEIVEIGFEDIPDGLKKLKEGGVKGRIVANITDEDRKE